MTRGILDGLLSAVLFGVSTPLAKKLVAPLRRYGLPRASTWVRGYMV